MEEFLFKDVELTGYVLCVSCSGYLLITDKEKEWHRIDFPMEKYKYLIENVGVECTFGVSQKPIIKIMN